MSTLLSLYTSKILSEHPLAVWALEDKADYVSLLDQQGRDLSLWSSDLGSVVVEEDTSLTGPVLDETVYSITDTPATDVSPITFRIFGDAIGSLSSLDYSLGTFSVSASVYVPVGSVLSMSIGVSYNDDTYGLSDISKKISRLINDKWMLMSETFDIPQGLSEDYNMFIEVEYIPTSSLDPATVFVSGAMVGQWSEEFFQAPWG